MAPFRENGIVGLEVVFLEESFVAEGLDVWREGRVRYSCSISIRSLTRFSRLPRQEKIHFKPCFRVLCPWDSAAPPL